MLISVTFCYSGDHSIIDKQCRNWKKIKTPFLSNEDEPVIINFWIDAGLSNILLILIEKAKENFVLSFDYYPL